MVSPQSSVKGRRKFMYYIYLKMRMVILTGCVVKWLNVVGVLECVKMYTDR